ncbi:unnamed protein product [Adineta steineri]|uniref:RBR-type E3 ubiquitin transferase n=3 Tax=Adineta steineri TaxID=433720 RepID=A0A815II16_9BILA|nr:unnamed protein product [Adineta steineri]
MTNDKQQQEEELLILKSILGDAITDLSNENDQFEIDIEFQLSRPFHLRLIDNANQLSTVIQHLPPLILTIHFHDQYPSSIHSPTFVLSSCYLSRTYLENMCRKLDEIWEQNLSQPIIFQWIECLKEEFSSVNELCLTNLETNNENDDPRAMSSYEPDRATRIYQQLIEYNQEIENEKFLHEYHECPICMSNDISGRDMIRLHKCHHTFCRACLHDYAQMHINTGSVEWLLCPDTQCQLALLPSEIKIIINNNELYDKYERLLLQKTLEQMLDIVWCPRCQQAVLTGNENDNLALCDQCRFAFCKKCKKTYHSQTLCAMEQELIELKEKRRKALLKWRGLKLTEDDEKNLLREFLAVARIENSTRLCPNSLCQVPIEKNEGCDHMFCVRCRTNFNWSEAKDQTTEAKALFEQYGNDLDKLNEEIRDERDDETDINNLKVLELPLVTKLLMSRTKKCPNMNCGKHHVKSGASNYIICQHCKRGFCFSCGNSVAKPNSHFGQGCKRHSDT